MFRTFLTPFLVLAAMLLTAPQVLAGGAPKGDAYPLATCPVSGMKLGAMGDPVVLEHEGREIRFCCKGCVPKFQKEAAKYLVKIDAEIAKEQTTRYPLTTCLVSGEALGEEGMVPVDVIRGNRLYRLCCKGCIRDLDKDPVKFRAKLDAAVVEAQKKDYPLDTCVVAGGKLGGMGAPVDYVHGNRLVRFCCKGCIAKFRKNPRAYLAKIDAAAKGSEAGGSSDDDDDGSCGSCEGSCEGSCGEGK